MDQIYQQALLDMAAQTRRLPEISRVDASAVKNNPICGDQVTLSVQLQGQQIAASHLAVRGCALCEAGAGLWHQLATGRDLAQLPVLADALAIWLKGESEEMPDAAASCFEPVRAIKNRHKCVLLAFEAGRQLDRQLDPKLGKQLDQQTGQTAAD